MPKVGDKYIIEIESVYGKRMEFPAKDWKEEDPMEIQMDAKLPKGPNRIYKIKGFNTLVFDDEGLRRLEKYEPEQAEAQPVKIGDEVIQTDGRRFWVTFVSKNALSDGKEIISGIDNNGYSVLTDTSELRTTGRHNKAIVSVVEDLKKQPKYSPWE